VAVERRDKPLSLLLQRLLYHSYECINETNKEFSQDRQSSGPNSQSRPASPSSRYTLPVHPQSTAESHIKTDAFVTWRLPHTVQLVNKFVTLPYTGFQRYMHNLFLLSLGRVWRLCYTSAVSWYIPSVSFQTVNTAGLLHIWNYRKHFQFHFLYGYYVHVTARVPTIFARTCSSQSTSSCRKKRTNPHAS
jgi:hypothetical protein